MPTPRSWRDSHTYGGIYFRDGKYQLAIDEYTKAIALKPGDAVAYYNRGSAYAKLGRYQLTIQDYTKAIALKPGDAFYYSARGWAYANMGQNEKADADKYQACSIDRRGSTDC